MPYTLRQETITGADLTGSDGDSSRTYTLSYSSAQSQLFEVVVDGSSLQPDVTYSLASDVVTFLLPIFDSQNITLNYLTAGGSVVLGVTYCTPADVQLEIQRKTAFTASTNPTLLQVTQMIMQAEDTIDRQTCHSWRELSVANEFYNIDIDTLVFSGAGIRIPLRNQNIYALDTSQGDKVEIWNGDGYTDYVTEKTEGRSNDFWIDYVQGVLWLKIYPIFFFKSPIRMSYRYGESSVPGDIEACAAKIVVKKILLNEDHSFVLDETGGGRNTTYDYRVSVLDREIKDILYHRQEFKTL